MKRVLIFEDNPLNIKLATAILVRAGYEVEHATDAPSGIERARAWQPDLILMEVQLPGVDGLSATRTLKNEPATRAIPVIALTAFAMKGDEQTMLAAGCDGYIPKPIRYHDFLARVAAVIGPGANHADHGANP